jgi:hypothetical protein
MSVLCFMHFFYKINLSFFGNSVQNLSRIFHVRNLSSLNYPNFYCVRNLSSLNYPNFYYVRNLSTQNLSKILYWTTTGRIQYKVRTCQNLSIGFVPKKWTLSGHSRLFQTYSGHFRRQFPDIYFL